MVGSTRPGKPSEFLIGDDFAWGIDVLDPETGLGRQSKAGLGLIAFGLIPVGCGSTAVGDGGTTRG